MKWLDRLAALTLGALLIGAVKNFLDKNQVVVFSKEDFETDFNEDEEDEEAEDILKLRPANLDNAMDLRGTPTHVCPCGCHIWNLKVIFDNYEIATYFLDMECANCGSLATAPTPVDREGLDN